MAASMFLGCVIAAASWSPVLAVVSRPVVCWVGVGCVLQVSVDFLGLLVREILGWLMISLARGPRVLTGQLRGDLLEHDGVLGVLGLNWRGA